MASKSSAPTDEFDLEAEIDDLSNLMERTKVLYEQYFMGIQKRAPEVLHRQVERRMRKLMQLHIRNTGHRFRFQTLSQKYGSYNTYWRRTMRAIEQGRYTRHLAKAGRRAAAEGKEIPEELLSSMPKRLREKLKRDREKLRRRHDGGGDTDDRPGDGGEAVAGPADGDQGQVRQPKKKVFELDENELDGVDFDAMFSAIKLEKTNPGSGPSAAVKQARTQSPAASPAAPTPARPSQPNPGGATRPQPSRPQPSRPPPTRPTAARPSPAPPPRPTAARPSPTPGKTPPAARARQAPAGMTEQQTRALYDRFVQAKKLVGADTTKLTYDKLVSTLNKQAPKIMEQHRAKGVKFDVVIEDNSVVLKAKPVKG